LGDAVVLVVRHQGPSQWVAPAVPALPAFAVGGLALLIAIVAAAKLPSS
jgi:hypothetical protein